MRPKSRIDIEEIKRLSTEKIEDKNLELKDNFFVVPINHFINCFDLGHSAFVLMTYLTKIHSNEKEYGKEFAITNNSECVKNTGILRQNLKRAFMELINKNKIIIGRKNEDKLSGNYIVVIPSLVNPELHNKSVIFLSQLTDRSVDEIEIKFKACLESLSRKKMES